MTTTVKIQAHCASSKEVHVDITESGNPVEHLVLQNGEQADRYAFDSRVISVKEVSK